MDLGQFPAVLPRRERRHRAPGRGVCFLARVELCDVLLGVARGGAVAQSVPGLAHAERAAYRDAAGQGAAGGSVHRPRLAGDVAEERREQWAGLALLRQHPAAVAELDLHRTRLRVEGDEQGEGTCGVVVPDQPQGLEVGGQRDPVRSPRNPRSIDRRGGVLRRRSGAGRGGVEERRLVIAGPGGDDGGVRRADRDA